MPDPVSRAAGAAPAGPAAGEAKLKAACDEMEALFLQHLLSEMRKTVPKSGLIDGGRSEEIYTALMDAETAKQMARSGGLGLAEILRRQLAGTAAPSGRNGPDR